MEEVYADGSVLISEMNYDYHNAFRTTTLRRGVRWPDGFIHVKDLVTGSAAPFGTLDAIKSVHNGVQVHGWAIDPDTNNPINVHVYVNDVLASAVTADRSRPDVDAVHHRGADHGYSLTLNPPRDAIVKVYGINAGGGDNPLLGSMRVPASTDPYGNLDSVARVGDSVQLLGWALDNDTADPISVHVYRNGVYLAAAGANTYRPDVDRVHHRGTNHGFEILVPAGAASDVYRVYAIGFGAGGNHSLGEKKATTPAGDLKFDAPVATVSGTATVGSTLSMKMGQWVPQPLSLAYQWTRDGKAIAGATSSSYMLKADDGGKKIALVITAKRTGYATKVITTSSVTVPSLVLAATPVPEIAGSPTVGKTLTARVGEWKPAPVKLAYQWLRDGSAIAGATGADYKLVAADVGKKVSVKVTGSKAGYMTVSQTSARTAAVAAAPKPTPTPSPSPSPKPTPSPSPSPSPSGKEFTAVSVPRITGSVKVGKKLTADVGAWGPGDVALSYQWYRSGAKIAKATSSTYKLVAADRGKKITVKVTGMKPGYTTVSKTSVATKKVAAGSLTSVTPKISGTVKMGKKLTARPGTWKPSGVKLSYQWLRNGKAIKGATKSVYKLAKADKGKKITVKVTGKKAGYTTKSSVSKATKKVG